VGLSHNRIETHKLTPNMAYFRPWPYSFAGFCLFILLAWISMAGLDFDGTLRASSFTTAGWFGLGFPFIAGVGVAFAAFVANLARRRHAVIACLMLALALGLLLVSLHPSRPANRVSAIIGESAAKHVIIERLRVADSFNERQTTWGIISGPQDLLDAIVQHRSLEMSPQASLAPLRAMFPDDSLPEFGDVARDRRSIFYRDPGTGKIFFQKK
jgi:hypothetical protein